ncbi:filamentous hemagglutinin family N-terminal domain [Xenococcus sp. PCC 7305]|uniref:two-partner secretion domain-containing protein n=1 Tax=Xenococcus sp. PCC 7305 TaxID=102125 RepID=UPI0002AC9FAE|nr:filamentous hemagglutinin N-terminal domain-containing protein [Xenococcus sp. PCC 7305]ELS02868.1 filamentous hemagglutinin family N-terminal domain [Xenococcus sp. PCC 7305]
MLASRVLTYRVEQTLTTTILSVHLLGFAGDSVLAQVVPDGTLDTQVNLIDGQHRITGGIESGTNLFHSFEIFSPNTDVTYFENNSNIQNIFTRVTGGSASLIDGLIKVNDNASLFILNPAGIIFGQNTQLDIGGSFVTTTAESIIFANGTKFGAQLDQTSALLTVNIPIGLQYGNAPGSISSNNTEPITLDFSPENNISPGKTIAFLGGNVDLKNISIRASSGNVEIGSVAQGGIVGLSSVSNGWKFDYKDVDNFNDIQISQSDINTSGKSGTIILRGKNIFATSSLLTNTDSDIGIVSLAANDYIDLDDSRLFTGDLLPSGQESNETLASSNAPVTTLGGDIIVSAKDIEIRNGTVISANNFSGQLGSNITIKASKSVGLFGFNDSFPSLVLSIVGQTGAQGGVINIETDQLVVKDGARIDSRSFGTGKAGNINVEARESILISGTSFSNNAEQILNSGLLASAGVENSSNPNLGENDSVGESGRVNVNTPQLSIEDGGEISVSNFGEKDAGNLTINAKQLLLTGDGQIIAKTASGNGGSININSNELILRDQASISATADFKGEGNDGNGGNINITADNIVLFDESTISANANLGSGGNITITTQSLLTQDNPEDVITASSKVKGLEGIVTIKTPDTNSKLETTQQRRSPLAGEEAIYTGCSLGTDFSANKFSYIGRGGIRKGPFDPLETTTVIADLGVEDSEAPVAELNSRKIPQTTKIEEEPASSITEATAWVVNEQGNVELIAQASNNALSSGCLFK